LGQKRNGIRPDATHILPIFRTTQANLGGVKAKKLQIQNSFLSLYPQIKYSFFIKGVWFLLRRAERLGSWKPWQPICDSAGNGAKT
jgi:hypothetical protein